MASVQFSEAPREGRCGPGRPGLLPSHSSRAAQNGCWASPHVSIRIGKDKGTPATHASPSQRERVAGTPAG